MTLRTAFVALAVTFFSGLTASADPGGLAIAGRTGTLGFGGDLMVNVLPDVNLRLGIGTCGFSHDGEFSDVDYDFDLDLLTYPVTLDWYPFDDCFHLSGGVIFNETEMNLDSTYSGSVIIGDNIYTPTEVGVLSGHLGFNDVAPYVGLGWGNAFGQDQRWGLVTDFGVAFIGSPTVTLSATGTLASTPGFLLDLAKEAANVQDDVDVLRVYPVFSANLFFRF